MRIAIMLRTLDEHGGISVYTRNLVRALLDQPTAHEYLLLYRTDRHRGTFGQHERVSEQVLPARSKAVWDQFSVPWACRRLKADVLLNPKFTLPLLSGCPGVMVLHGADWYLPDAAQFYGRFDHLYIRLFMPLYLRKAAGIISVSRLTTEDFQRVFGFPEGRIQTVYFGPAPHFGRVTDGAKLQAIRERYGLPDRFILTLSKVGGAERKNLGGLLQAYSRVHGKVPHKLVVGGKGCARFRKDFSIPDSGWGRDVLFPGWLDQSDLPAIYSAADLFLYPSNQEAFPIPITEAMTCGTPIVTSRANGLLELAGDAALLVNPDDADEIAAAVQRVLSDTALASQLSEAGLKRSAMFSWERCAKNTLAVLEDAVAGRVRDADAGRLPE
jgi:glycosyltransferase involved in cell wall biosynthesis